MGPLHRAHAEVSRRISFVPRDEWLYWSIRHRYFRKAVSSEVKVEDATFTVPSNSSKSYNHGKCIPLACAFDEDDLAF